LQVEADLRHRIASGEFAVGDQLPSLRALRTEYDVAEVTVHSAIKELQRAGLVASTTGRGTFVTAIPDVGEPFDLRVEVEDLKRRVERLERGNG
jgi:DNA-binding GntR family transcriptional regulator